MTLKIKAILFVMLLLLTTLSFSPSFGQKGKDLTDPAWWKHPPKEIPSFDRLFSLRREILKLQDRYATLMMDTVMGNKRVEGRQEAAQRLMQTLRRYRTLESSIDENFSQKVGAAGSMRDQLQLAGDYVCDLLDRSHYSGHLYSELPHLRLHTLDQVDLIGERFCNAYFDAVVAEDDASQFDAILKWNEGLLSLSQRQSNNLAQQIPQIVELVAGKLDDGARAQFIAFWTNLMVALVDHTKHGDADSEAVKYLQKYHRLLVAAPQPYNPAKRGLFLYRPRDNRVVHYRVASPDWLSASDCRDCPGLTKVLEAVGGMNGLWGNRDCWFSEMIEMGYVPNVGPVCQRTMCDMIKGGTGPGALGTGKGAGSRGFLNTFLGRRSRNSLPTGGKGGITYPPSGAGEENPANAACGETRKGGGPSQEGCSAAVGLGGVSSTGRELFYCAVRGIENELMRRKWGTFQAHDPKSDVCLGSNPRTQGEGETGSEKETVAEDTEEERRENERRRLEKEVIQLIRQWWTDPVNRAFIDMAVRQDLGVARGVAEKVIDSSLRELGGSLEVEIVFSDEEEGTWFGEDGTLEGYFETEAGGGGRILIDPSRVLSWSDREGWDWQSLAPHEFGHFFFYRLSEGALYGKFDDVGREHRLLCEWGIGGCGQSQCLPEDDGCSSSCSAAVEMVKSTADCYAATQEIAGRQRRPGMPEDPGAVDPLPPELSQGCFGRAGPDGQEACSTIQCAPGTSSALCGTYCCCVTGNNGSLEEGVIRRQHGAQPPGDCTDPRAYCPPDMD